MLHMIGNAHLDPVWLWQWTEGCAEAIGTCWAAIDRLEETEAFVFTRGEAQVYAWIEELDPELFERIRHFVAVGRWVIVNGWWIQPDCNLPSGESFIRQALYGKRYFADRFGIKVPVGYNVDSFGHAVTLPMLLRHTQSHSYVFMRPGPHEMELPADLFDWQAPDGSRVATFRIQIAYNTSPINMGVDEKIDYHLKKADDDLHSYMCFYGVGNHGGGPTRDTLAKINARVAAGAPVAYSDPNRYFDTTASEKRPVVSSELQFHAIGCYAAAGTLKALNRRAEARLGQAEAAATLALRVAGTPYPRAALGHLWQKLLFNQFHDTLGGTSIESACVDAESDFRSVLAGADTILNASVRRLASTIAPLSNPSDAGIVFMNFNAEAFNGLCEVEPWTDFDAATPRLLLDENEEIVPFQFIDPAGKMMGLQRLALRLRIEGYGYRLLHFADRSEGAVAPTTRLARLLRHNEFEIETEGWALKIDGVTGAIIELINKASGISVFDAPAHLGSVVDDPTDTWSHDVDRFGFHGVEATLEKIIAVEDGPLRRTVKIMVRLGQSTMMTTVLIPNAADLPIELRVCLDWREQRKLLRLAYPLAATHFEYEVPAGWTARPDDGREVFGHAWVRGVGSDATITIVNDAKYSYAALDGTLYLTATRSPVYAHHDPVKLQQGAPYRYLDQGEQSFVLRIGASPSASRKDAQRMANELLRPPVITPHVSRNGTAPHAGQWLKVESLTTAVLALKTAEETDESVVRAIELDGKTGAMTVSGHLLSVPPRGIATATLGADGLKPCDGLETGIDVRIDA